LGCDQGAHAICRMTREGVRVCPEVVPAEAGACLFGLVPLAVRPLPERHLEWSLARLNTRDLQVPKDQLDVMAVALDGRLMQPEAKAA
jgi:hypothetical protein